MQVDKTTDVSTKEQLSVIIRLDKNDDVVERLLKFYDVSLDRTAPAISAIIKDIQNRNQKIVFYSVNVYFYELYR